MKILGQKQFQLLAAVLLSLGLSSPWTQVDAQIINPKPIITSHLYIAKFVCGFEQGQTPPQINKGLGGGTPLPNQISPPFRNFQPGSYSTTLNIFNISNRPETISVFASIDGATVTPSVATLSLGSFLTGQIGCQDIVNNLAIIAPTRVLTGDLIEGFLYIKRFRRDLDVQVVYSYSSKDAFHEFRGDDGLVAGTGAAGAGGLGVGASVDVEHIEPIETNNTLILIPNK